jgi:hypothetical protein
VENKHHTKVFILKPDGSEVPLAQWQEGNGYEVGSSRIAKHFWFTESKFMENIQDYGKIVVCELLMKIADKYRDIKVASIRVNSFNRSREKQLQLIDGGFKAAAVSPHEYFLAIDVDTDTDQETRLNAAMIREAAKQLGIKVRIGFEQYLADKMTFIHFDVCPEYFAKGKPWHHIKHPIQWETENQW